MDEAAVLEVYAAGMTDADGSFRTGYPSLVLKRRLLRQSRLLQLVGVCHAETALQRHQSFV